MKSLGFILVALGCAPFLLFPSVAAFMGGKRSAWLILAINVLLGAWIFWGFRVMHFDGAGFPGPGLLLSVVSWLILIGVSLRKDAVLAEQIDEPVTLAAYDSHWPVAFEEEHARLASTLDLEAGAFEHIGSTAVPTLEAKPVVDIMLGLTRLPPSPSFLSRLGILGYENLGEAGVPDRVYLRLRGERDFNLHVVERDGVHWRDNLALRGLLRRDPVARARYAAAKRAALQSGGARLLAYSAAKAPAIAELLASARQA